MILNHDFTGEDAERKAKKTSTDGKGFYEIWESTWKEKYGQQSLPKARDSTFVYQHTWNVLISMKV